MECVACGIPSCMLGCGTPCVQFVPSTGSVASSAERLSPTTGAQSRADHWGFFGLGWMPRQSTRTRSRIARPGTNGQRQSCRVSVHAAPRDVKPSRESLSWMMRRSAAIGLQRSAPFGQGKGKSQRVALNSWLASRRGRAMRCMEIQDMHHMCDAPQCEGSQLTYRHHAH